MNKYAAKRRILIVGEGRETEYNYFVGLRNTFELQLAESAISVSVVRGKGGSARNIVEHAVKESKKFKPDRKKRGDRVFLLLDTEGTGREPELPDAERIARDKNIELIYSCPAFEYWLLCHFDKLSRGYFKDCASVIKPLDKNWAGVCNISYDKSDRGIFKRLENLLSVATDQSLDVDISYISTQRNARRANPSTQVYELVAMLIGVEMGKKMPNNRSVEHARYPRGAD